MEDDRAGSGMIIRYRNGPPIYCSLVPQWRPTRDRSAAIGDTRITACVVDGGQPFYVLSRAVPVQDDDDEIVGTCVEDCFVRRLRIDAIRVPAIDDVDTEDHATTFFQETHEPASAETQRSPVMARIALPLRIGPPAIGFESDPKPPV